MTAEPNSDRANVVGSGDVAALTTALVRDAQHLQKLLTGGSPQPTLSVVRSADEHRHTSCDNIDRLKHYLAARRRRTVLFPYGLFADPAWDILLDLFVARAEGRAICVTSACIASGVPATTALRWLKCLEQREMIVRRSDKYDGRRVYIRLTDATFSLIDQWVAGMWPPEDWQAPAS